MKDNYSWLDQSHRAIIDYKDPEIAIVEVAKQFEIEKLRARIDEVKRALNFIRTENMDLLDDSVTDYLEKCIADLTEKLKELESS